MSKSPNEFAAPSVTTSDGSDATELIVLVESSVLFCSVWASPKTANVSIPVSNGKVNVLSAARLEPVKI